MGSPSAMSWSGLLQMSHFDAVDVVSGERRQVEEAARLIHRHAVDEDLRIVALATTDEHRGLSAERADALHRSEQAALAVVREVVVTSPATAKLVASDYGVSAEHITVARPGSDPAPCLGSC